MMYVWAVYAAQIFCWSYVSKLIFQGTPNSSIPLSAQSRIISMLSDRLSNLHAALRGDAAIILRVFHFKCDLEI